MTLQYSGGRDANVRALVDVHLVLAKLEAEQTRIGEWVNVLGYVTSRPLSPAGKLVMHEGPSVHVQALLLWSAGPLDVQQYHISAEALLDERTSPTDQSEAPSMALARE